MSVSSLFNYPRENALPLGHNLPMRVVMEENWSTMWKSKRDKLEKNELVYLSKNQTISSNLSKKKNI